MGGHNLSIFDGVVLVTYLALMLLMGVFFSRKNTSTEQYFLGNRSFGGWLIGISLVGTSISSLTFLAYPADAYKTAWLRFIPNFAMPIGVAVAAMWFLPFFRRRQITSAYEFLEERFGLSVRMYGAFVFIVAQLARLSVILYLVAVLAQTLTGIDTVYCILIAGVLVGFYTVIGGIDAVIWTDVIQTIVLTLGGLVCLAVIVGELPDGLSEVFRVGIADGKLSFRQWADGQLQPIDWGFSVQDKTFVMMLLVGLIAWLTEYSSNQNTIQRFCASKSTAEARKAMWVCVGCSLPIWAFYMFLGTALYVFFKAFPTDTSVAVLTGDAPAEQILPHFILGYLPTGIRGLVVASVLAAAMSSLDSSINAVSTVFTIDFYKRLIAPGRGDRHYLVTAWIAATVASLCMIGGGIVLASADSKTLMDTSTVITSLLGAGMLSIYLLGFFTNRGGSASVWLGIVATLVFTAWTIASGRFPERLPSFLVAPFDLYYTGIIGNVIMFGIGYVAGWLLPQSVAANVDPTPPSTTSRA